MIILAMRQQVRAAVLIPPQMRIFMRWAAVLVGAVPLAPTPIATLQALAATRRQLVVCHEAHSPLGPAAQHAHVRGSTEYLGSTAKYSIRGYI